MTDRPYILVRRSQWAERLVVYQITNLVNGKRYVGVCQDRLRDRMTMHEGHRTDPKSAHRPLYRAMTKYGADLFRVEVLVRCGSYEEALAEEVRLIEAMEPEYNLSRGGEGSPGHPVSQATRRKLSASLKGNRCAAGAVRDADQRARISATLKANHSRSFLGRTHTASARAKISAAGKADPGRMTKALAAVRRPVICTTNGIVFESGTEAARFFGVSQAGVSQACRGKLKSIKGRQFEYLAGEP